jgi:membrane protease subunit HflC
MRNPIALTVGAAIALAAFLLYESVFTVYQTEQALVLHFGEPAPGRALVTEPGLHFKEPLVDTVAYVDNRILDLETPPQEVLASDNNRIRVDAFLRYKVVDVLRFYQQVRNTAGAESALSNVLDSAVRRVLSEATQAQIVTEQRASLMVKIKEQVERESQKFGVSIVDARIRRADLPPQISEKVYSRMQTERAREAAQYRAQGSQQAQEITAKADRDVIVVRAEAQQAADQLRGAGEAERNAIFADAYGKDPEFFAFWRSMQAYEAGLKSGDTRMVLSPTSDFFHYFGAPKGGAPAAK